MGTQQMLVIVLSVIIVGVGVSVGFFVFQNQAYNANRLTVANEMQQYVKASVQYWKTPTSQGGAGAEIRHIRAGDIALAIGFQTFRGGPYNGNYGTTSENGDFIVVGLENDVLILKGLGHEAKSGKRPMVQMNINLNTYMCRTTYSDAEGF